ncbi:MAG: hypothetical protein IJH41_04865 [Eubacterium sp.]|nr:hypothetical protein [Eubacterium sp.]
MNNIQRAKKRIADEIKICNELHYRFAKHLSRIAVQPTYEKMEYTKKNGRKYYSEVWVEEGKKHTSYLGDETDLDVKAIKEKHFLSRALKKLDEHIVLMEKYSENIEPFDCVYINRKLPKVYQLTDDHLKQVVGLTSEEKWYQDALKEKSELDEKYGISYESELTHKAKDGTLTRSKSEVAIFNEFLERGKPCIYEMPTHVKPYLMHPDFTFYSNRYNRPIIWEHAGMLGDPDYMQSFSERMDKYIRAGFVPCVDIIFTFDTMRGDIDSGMIKTLLDEYE